MRASHCTSFILVLLFSIGTPFSTPAQHAWAKVNSNLVKFDSNCASTDVFREADLAKVLPRALKHAPEDTKIPATAFAFDLNGDKSDEYFVPIECGATGNCTWAVFKLNPSQFLWFVNGETIYVHTRLNTWPDIFAYGHLSAAEGVLETYRFRKGGYAIQKDHYAIGDPSQSLDIQTGPAHKMPKKLLDARKACVNFGE